MRFLQFMRCVRLRNLRQKRQAFDIIDVQKVRKTPAEVLFFLRGLLRQQACLSLQAGPAGPSAATVETLQLHALILQEIDQPCRLTPLERHVSLQFRTQPPPVLLDQTSQAVQDPLTCLALQMDEASGRQTGEVVLGLNRQLRTMQACQG